MISSEELKKLKSQGKTLKAFMQIGNNGISDNTITQIKKYLVAHQLGKIKATNSVIENMNVSKNEFAKLLAQKTGATLIDRVGFTIVLWKR